MSPTSTSPFESPAPVTGVGPARLLWAFTVLAVAAWWRRA